MKNICLCFHVHHPFHFQTFKSSDIGTNKPYFDDVRIEKEIHEAAINYYLPSNSFLLKLINQFKGKLKLAFYISGTASDQFLMYQPKVLTSFRELADTGNVEFLGGTSSHSLVTLTNHKKELVQQIKDNQAQTKYLFGIKPRVFVNTDLIYSDMIGKDIGEAGYRAIITNGSRKTLTWRSPNYVYSNILKPKMDVYFRNEQLSNELANQLSSFGVDPKTSHPNSFFSLINNPTSNEPLFNIYLDYKALGGLEIEKKQQFMEAVIAQIYKSKTLGFIFPSEIAERIGSVATIAASEPICWVNNFHSNYYPGNDLQVEAIKQLYLLQNTASRIDDDINLQKDWQYLQTSDHFHLMDDQHPIYQNSTIENHPFKNRFDAFINFMNILDDFRLKIQTKTGKGAKKQPRKQHQ